MTLPFFGDNKEKKKKKEVMRSYQNPAYADLARIKANEKYVYHSDYFTIDNYYATIMTFVHRNGADDGFDPFWAVALIPNLPKGVVTINFEQIKRMGQGWIISKKPKAERVAGKNKQAQDENGSLQDRLKANKSSQDLIDISRDLNNGDSYLNVKMRLLVKAPTLEKLDQAVDQINREYIDRLGTISAAPYNGRQKSELYNLMMNNEVKYGKGFYFTSSEYAGSYDLVTNGLEDPNGVYVGYLYGDVNSPAVLFDADDFKHHAVIASDQIDDDFQLGNGFRQKVTDMWGLKIAQMALMHNHRVVHLVLTPETDMEKIGPAMNSITYKIDMEHGDVNMFEMFGDFKDSLSIFQQQTRKLVLMAEQIARPSKDSQAILENFLQKIIAKFYIYNHMWVPDAQHHLDRLRAVGQPHQDVPTLSNFITYLETAYKQQLTASVSDPDEVRAANTLRGIFNTLLIGAGDLFNTHTTDKIDKTVKGQRIIYDFGSLMLRGPDIAMAQLVNILGYALSTLKAGDVLIIHGAEHIDPRIREYCNMLFEQLYSKGGRIVFLYNDLDKFMDDQKFNHFDSANYTIIGNMVEKQMSRYEELMGTTVPSALRSYMTSRGKAFNYIRRQKTNVVFVMQMQMWPSKIDYGYHERRHY